MADIRRVAAALANDDARRVFAEAVLADERRVLAGPRRQRALASLREAGLVDADGAAAAAPFRQLLVEHGRAQSPKGPERFFRDGRIESLPATPRSLAELLVWLLPRVIREGEELTESQVNERLLAVYDDFAVLRRHLVDARLVIRTPSGSSYRLA